MSHLAVLLAFLSVFLIESTWSAVPSIMQLQSRKQQTAALGGDSQLTARRSSDVALPMLRAKVQVPIRLSLRGGGEGEGNDSGVREDDEVSKLVAEGWALCGEGDPLEAERIFNAALRKDPNCVEAMCKLAILYEFELIEYGKAEALYKRAMEVSPDDVTLVYDFAVFLQERKRDYDAAEITYEKAMGMAPEDGNVLNNYAVFLQTCRNDTARADEVFKRALAASPNASTTLCNYASFLENALGHLDEAQSLYVRALEYNPKDASALYNYAVFLDERVGDTEGAEGMYKRCLALDDNDMDALNNYGLLLQDRGDYMGARTMLERALSVEAADLATINNLAILLGDCFRDVEAAELMHKRAIEVGPEDVQSLCNYGGFLKHWKDDEGTALELFRKAAEVNLSLARKCMEAVDRRAVATAEAIMADQNAPCC